MASLVCGLAFCRVRSLILFHGREGNEMFKKCLLALVVFGLIACTAISAIFNPLNPFEYDVAVNYQMPTAPYQHGAIYQTVSSNNWQVNYQYNQYTSVKFIRIGAMQL